MKQGGALIIHLTLLLTWGAWALDGGALRSVPTCFESVFMPVVNLYYKSRPRREWQASRTAPNGGLAPEVRGRDAPAHANRHALTRAQFAASQGQKQRPASITIYLRSVKFNSLLYPLVPSNELQH